MSLRANTLLIGRAGKKLIHDVATLWSSTYLMLVRLLILKKFIQQICGELGLRCLTSSDWAVILNYCPSFETFCCSRYFFSPILPIPTLSSVIPIVEALRLHFTKVSARKFKFFVILIFVVTILNFLDLHFYFTFIQVGKNRGWIAACHYHLKTPFLKPWLQRGQQSDAGRSQSALQSLFDDLSDEFEPIYLTATTLDQKMRLYISARQVEIVRRNIVKLNENFGMLIPFVLLIESMLYL